MAALVLRAATAPATAAKTAAPAAAIAGIAAATAPKTAPPAAAIAALVLRAATAPATTPRPASLAPATAPRSVATAPATAPKNAAPAAAIAALLPCSNESTHGSVIGVGPAAPTPTGGLSGKRSSDTEAAVSRFQSELASTSRVFSCRSPFGQPLPPPTPPWNLYPPAGPALFLASATGGLSNFRGQHR